MQIPAPPNAAALKPLTVTVPTALALTQLGRTKFYDLINAGKIKTVKIGSRTLVNYASLEALTAEGSA